MHYDDDDDEDVYSISMMVGGFWQGYCKYDLVGGCGVDCGCHMWQHCCEQKAQLQISKLKL